MSVTDDRTARLGELRKAVDEAAGQARQLTFLMLTVGLYIGITGATTTHRMLLVGGTIQMPILNVGVDLLWFYRAAPILFLVLHAWLMGAMVSLSRRIDALNREIDRLPGVERRYQRGLVAAFPFVEWRAGFLSRVIERALSAAINWTIYVGLPVALFLWIQLRFLPYQDAFITGLHAVSLAADLMLIWFIWPEVNGPTRSLPGTLAGAVGTIGVVLLAALMMLDQRHPWMRWAEAPSGSVYLPSTFADWAGCEPPPVHSVESERHTLISTFEYCYSRLVVTNKVLMEREPSPQVMAAFLARAKEGKEDDAQLAAFLDKALADPLNLSGRNLRRADLSGSRMPGLVLDSNTHLEGSNLSGTDLAKAFMSGASLQGARLVYASLQGANLDDAKLQGASLFRASLRGASLFRCLSTGCPPHPRLAAERPPRRRLFTGRPPRRRLAPGCPP